MADWKNERRKGEIKSATLDAGRFRLSVHRHIHFGADQWLASSSGLMDCRELKSADLDDAKKEAEDLLASILKDALVDLGAASDN